MAGELPRCARCGSRIPVTLSDARLCPVCLMSDVLDDDDEAALDLDADPPYQIITVLARGTSGTTYLAAPIGTTRRVALKVVGPRTDVRAVVERFERWRRLVAFERFPGVARLLDVGPAPRGCIYLAWDYVQGPSLAGVLQRGALSPSASRGVLAQVSGAVLALKARGVAHMRLTPERIRVSGEDDTQVGIIGFGQALVLDAAAPSPDRDLESVALLSATLGHPA